MEPRCRKEVVNINMNEQNTLSKVSIHSLTQQELQQTISMSKRINYVLTTSKIKEVGEMI